MHIYCIIDVRPYWLLIMTHRAIPMIAQRNETQCISTTLVIIVCIIMLYYRLVYTN